MKFKPQFDALSPMVEFFEDGPDWLRVEAQNQPTRYLRRSQAEKIMRAIGLMSVKLKSDCIVAI